MTGRGRDFVYSGKFPRFRPSHKFLNGSLGDVNPAGNIDGFQPTTLPESPCVAVHRPQLIPPATAPNDQVATDSEETVFKELY